MCYVANTIRRVASQQLELEALRAQGAAGGPPKKVPSVLRSAGRVFLETLEAASPWVRGAPPVFIDRPQQIPTLGSEVVRVPRAAVVQTQRRNER